jgi:hypothetical protein
MEEPLKIFNLCKNYAKFNFPLNKLENDENTVG